MEELDNIQNIKIYLNPVNKESRTRTLKYKLIPFVLILTFVILQSKLFPFQEKQNIEARNLAETEMIKIARIFTETIKNHQNEEILKDLRQEVL